MYIVQNTLSTAGEVKVGDTWYVLNPGQSASFPSKPSVVSNGLLFFYKAGTIPAPYFENIPVLSVDNSSGGTSTEEAVFEYSGEDSDSAELQEDIDNG